MTNKFNFIRIMRRILLTAASIFTALFASGQTTADGEKVMVQLSELYNKESYVELYLMLSPESKSRISEYQLTSFYTNSIKNPFGNILSWKPAESKDSAINYSVQFDKGTLDLTFYLNSKNEITKIQWLPQKNTPDGETIMEQLSELYNKEAYKEMYTMHSIELKSQISEDQLISFYKNSIRIPMGKIVSWEPSESTGGTINYTVQFAKGALNLSLKLNNKNEIAAIEWLPSNNNNKDIKKKDVSEIRSNNPKHTKLQLLVDSLALDHLQNAANCGISIGIINGDNTEMFFYGARNKDIDELPDTKTLYEIGSVTKTFTAVLLAHAINTGKINADDDIRKYLPGTYPNLQYMDIPITIKNLSNHTSGLPRLPADLEKQPRYDAQDPYKKYSKEMMYSYLKKIKLKTLPGTVNEYSNFGVALLGVILEQVYQRSLEDLVRSYVTEPAKMTGTKFTLSSTEKAKLARGYNVQDGDEAPYWNLGTFIAAGGLKSNLADMVKYLRANMNEINADFKLSHEQTYKDANITVGLNWILTTTKDGQTLIWHNGETAGFSSFCGYIKEKNVGVVILNNSNTVVDNIAMNILK